MNGRLIKGGGSSPRSLSPSTGIWRSASPVECRLAASSPTLRRSCTDHEDRCGFVAKPATAVVTPRCGLPGEASGPGRTACLRACGPPDRVTSRLRNQAPRRDRRPQGRHQTGLPGRWPCATGLASYPLKLRSFLQAGEHRFGPRPRSDIIAVLGVSLPALRTAPFQWAHSAKTCPPCVSPAAEPEPSDGNH
jgi:hypothetical protein